MSKTKENVQVTLNDKELLGMWARWVCFLNGFVNYERMQGVGFCHAISPAIKKLYGKKEDRVSAYQRHLTFFNTNGTTGSIILGITAAMEEQKANGAEVDGETINAVKVSLMGPLAGLGDSIFQATIFPILLSIGIGLGLQGNIVGPLLYTVLVLAISYPLDYWWFKKSYKEGRPLLTKLMATGLLNKVTEGASMVGLLAAGTLTARYINFQIKYEIPLAVGEPISIQADILDKIAPNILPLLLVIGCWTALRRKVSVGKLILGIFIVGILVGAFGII
ncbi:PTS system mannose/fructose/sorbose family transporter subunit IID [Schnuerera sp.]|uniref:PTS system mannose/fructose/sorbose family transporter subunit IID n=1 Tax=Schnuerera sp. TaxID=2794844 RepID=UPI002D155B97|nr:PTS system mannose/fructose/sorbose family transporter subunit IID [Schnuerera sp.]HSH36966.1 PTS system mannose/fructose/sorbose family transporter subunit IID [Schnuerera sp.]